MRDIQKQTHKKMAPQKPLPPIPFSAPQQHRYLLTNICVSVHELIDAKHLPLTEFVACIFTMDQEVRDPEDTSLRFEDFKSIEYALQSIEISVPNYSEGDQDCEYLHTLRSENVITGFTRGELLYKLAHILPENQEWGDHVYFEGLSFGRDRFYLSLGS